MGVLGPICHVSGGEPPVGLGGQCAGFQVENGLKFLCRAGGGDDGVLDSVWTGNAAAGTLGGVAVGAGCAIGLIAGAGAGV